MSDNSNIGSTEVHLETNAATRIFPGVECGSIFMATDGCLYMKVQKLWKKDPKRRCFNAIELTTRTTRYFDDNDFVFVFDTCAFNYEI